jgi:hypothetical protein
VNWYQRADYRWLLLADPPICRPGRPEFVLNNCDRIRKAETCWCRFESKDITEDLDAIGQSGKADDWLTTGDLEPEDIEEFRHAMQAAVDRARASGTLDDDGLAGADRVDGLIGRLNRLIESGVGLSDRYADDID